MKTIVFCMIFGMFMNQGFAQGREIIELWPKDVPGETKPKSKSVISESSGDNVLRVTEVTNPILEVFQPKKPNGTAVIVCPGGGYNILALDKEGYEVAEWLNTLGITAFVLQYRVPQKHLGALQDAQRAIRIVRSQSKKFRINPAKVGIMGFSAGGSLSARASTLYNDQTYKSVDDADKLSAKPDFSLLIYPAYLDQGPERTLTPELKVSKETPPMYIFVTAEDKYANSSLVMAQALRDNQVAVELHMLPWGPHGYGLRKGIEAATVWPVLAEKWLNRSILNAGNNP